MKKVKARLLERRVPVYMVDAGLGDHFSAMTVDGMVRAKAIIAFCTDEYGAETGVGYETYRELQYAYENRLAIYPIRMSAKWPPEPQDETGMGRKLNKFVFSRGLVYVEDRTMSRAKSIADQIADQIAERGLFRHVERRKSTSL